MTIYTEKITRNKANHASMIMGKLARQIHHWFKMQETRHQLRLERRQLTMMTDEVLRDIGISRADAEVEAMRKDIPAARLCSRPGWY
jgi:uncharacterized protein YjiS (DUF1127 family)